MKLHTYLNYGGNCAEAFAFYETHLGAKILASMTYGQMPGAKNLPPEQEKFILHARLAPRVRVLRVDRNAGPTRCG